MVEINKVAALTRSYMNGLISFNETITKQQKRCPQPNNNNSCYTMTSSELNYCKLRRAPTLAKFSPIIQAQLLLMLTETVTIYLKKLKHWCEQVDQQKDEDQRNIVR